MGLGMNRQDLPELYQLASMYGKCYGGETNDLLEDISEKYRTVTGGEDIREARDPGKGGRKRAYYGKHGRDDPGYAPQRNAAETDRRHGSVLYRPCTGCPETAQVRMSGKTVYGNQFPHTVK